MKIGLRAVLSRFGGLAGTGRRRRGVRQGGEHLAVENAASGNAPDPYDDWDGNYADDCDDETPGNCRGCPDSEHDMCVQMGRLLHACILADGHEGRHVCCCGRNWR